MKGEKLEVVRGSGNVFRDLGHTERGCRAIQGDPRSRNHQGARSGTA